MILHSTSQNHPTRWSIVWLIALIACTPICASANYYYADDYYSGDYYADEYYYEEDAYYGYESEVYDAFTYSQPKAAPSSNLSGRQNAIGHPSDPDAENSEFPIGEPWTMVVLALAAAGYTFIRQRKTATNKQHINS